VQLTVCQPLANESPYPSRLLPLTLRRLRAKVEEYSQSADDEVGVNRRPVYSVSCLVSYTEVDTILVHPIFASRLIAGCHDSI